MGQTCQTCVGFVNQCRFVLRCVTTTAELDEQIMKGCDARFSLDIIKDYAATLTDRSVQRRLRDPKRKRSFSKVALDNRDGEEFILCESGDLVFEFDCKATSGGGVHTTGSLSKKPGTCCPRSVLHCTTCTCGSNSAERYIRTHAHVHERSYASCET